MTPWAATSAVLSVTGLTTGAVAAPGEGLSVAALGTILSGVAGILTAIAAILAVVRRRPDQVIIYREHGEPDDDEKPEPEPPRRRRGRR